MRAAIRAESVSTSLASPAHLFGSKDRAVTRNSRTLFRGCTACKW